MRRGVHKCVKHLTGIVLCLLVSLCCNIAVYACSFQSGIMTAIDYNCHVLTGGVTGRYFYKDSSTSIYNTIIGAAVSSWNTKSSDCSFTLTSNSGQAAIRYTTGTVSNPNSAGQTAHYYSSGSSCTPTNANWGYAIITLSTTEMSALTFSHKQGTCAHEFGHAIGLNHILTVAFTYEPTWIMTPYKNANGTVLRTATTPHTLEANIIDNHLY